MNKNPPLTITPQRSYIYNGDIERIETIKLLIVHGWHLLNSNTDKKPKSGKNKSNILDNLIVKRENELARASEFDLFLKSLSEKYAKFYDVKLPEPEENP